MGQLRLKVEDMLLDLENPRITKAGGQHDALQKIIDDQDVKLVALAESIVENGLNPMDRFLVLRSVEDSKKYIVLEGNRRLAAIKILANITVLTGLEVRSAIQKRLEALSRDFVLKNIQPIDCFEVGSRADGAMWIQQRHTGENQGRGIVDWNGVATARFRGRDPALQALDLVLKHGGLSDDQKTEIEEHFPISTLDRLLSTPAVRSKIGMDVISEKLVSNLPATEILKPLRRMVLDLASRTTNVTKLKTKDQQIEYISGFGKDLPTLSKKSGKAKPIDTFQDKDFKGASPAPAPKPKPKIAVRKALIPRPCQLNVTNAKVAEIYGELRRLPLADYPNSISVLFRVFLETSVDHYLSKSGIALTVTTPNGNKDKSLKSKVQEAIDHMKTAGVPKRHLDGVAKGIHDSHSPLYVDLLHNYVHNRFVSPVERDLKVAWDNSQPFFEQIWS